MGNRGQSFVEYVLLLAVLMTIGLSILQSDQVRWIFGEEGPFQGMTSYLEYTYSNGTKGQNPQFNYSDKRDIYFNNNTGQTRFFTPKDSYPN